MMWNEKRHYSPPLPVESASDHVTCERMLGVLSGRWWNPPSPKYCCCCCCFRFEIRETMAQALKRGWRSRRRLSLAPNVGRERSLSPSGDSAVMGGVSGRRG